MKFHSYGEIRQLQEDYSKCRYFSKQNISNQLNIEDASNDIIVNFTTREIVSIQGIEYEGNMYYTQYKLPNGQNIVSYQNGITNNLAFEETIVINGLEAEVKINNITRDGKQVTNCNLKYKLLPDNEAKYNNYEEYDSVSGYWINVENNIINMTKTGRYVIALSNNNNTILYAKEIYIELANEPLNSKNLTKIKYNSETQSFSELKKNEQWYDYSKTPPNWAYGIDDDLKYYIWIPRLAYDSSNNLKFLINRTNIATDKSKLPEGYTVSERFTGDEANGIWEEVTGAVQEISDIINILK